jgi:crotonobetainyl-CoA:carnitine CoA-transferase CaiB-like acyl-CoA transferase
VAEDASDQGFASWRQRVARREDVDALVAAYVAARSASEVIDQIGAARVPVGLSAAASDLLADPHMRARETFRLIHHPRLGAITLVGAPFRLHSVEGSDYPRPPLLGEHGDLVTECWLGSAARV